MRNSILKLSQYIDEVKEENAKINLEREKRIRFFFNKKLKSLMLNQKSVHSTLKTSDSLVFPLFFHPSIAEIEPQIEVMTTDEIFKILNKYSDFIAVDKDMTLAEMSSSLIEDPDKHTFLDYLHTHKYLRGAGLAKEFFKDLKSTAINNKCKKIKASMHPLDHPTDSVFYEEIFRYVHSKNYSSPNQNHVNIQTLSSIYKGFDFKIENSEDHQLIEMDVTKEALPSSDLLPVNFTNYDRNKETVIIM